MAIANETMESLEKTDSMKENSAVNKFRSIAVKDAVKTKNIMQPYTIREKNNGTTTVVLNIPR